ncbi:hypothetical protein BDN70DRAFT_883582 [Pholiota conissans]|uniref:Nephrocystin 3-like N-terminal domain-containing protein n=1 Tax=Pholiota conissans TaxID=109636 RepID=A0A9P6CXH3_9AGAR|nr:hypothetical protein BDN70DRAFT_883582 [Pholiota conissans]
MPPSNLQILTGASGFTNNGHFTAVGGDMYVYADAGSSQPYGLKLLLDNISPGAFHNAADRGDPPRCHPQTRIGIRKAIMEWINSSSADRKLILWLYGPAGAGKTAILHSIAEQCEEDESLAASFFFGRYAPGRNDLSRFAATLACKLSFCIPGMKKHLIANIEMDPTIFSLSLEVQMRALVVDPIMAVKFDEPRRIFAVIVDGLDECGPDEEARTKLINTLRDTAIKLQHVPLKFLLGSRSELEFRLAFNQEPLSLLMQGISLGVDYQSNADIILYLEGKFAEIMQKHRTLMLGTYFPTPWPAAHDMNRLVQKSSGQFIFPSTVVKFVDSPRRHPVERLNIILGLADAGNETPFAALDVLYTFILSAVDDLPKVLLVLTLLVLSKRFWAVRVVERLLGFEVRRALIDMHSLILVSDDDAFFDGHVVLLHASLHDFLLDRSRSKNFFIDAIQGHIFLSKQWMQAIKSYPDYSDNIVSLGTCISQFVSHSQQASSSAEVQDLLSSFNLRTLLEKVDMVDDVYLIDWSVFLSYTTTQGKFSEFQSQIYDLFADRIACYPSSARPSILALSCCVNVPQLSTYFSILLAMSGDSATELAELDEKLLMIEVRLRSPATLLFFFYKFFKRYYKAVLEESFASLAKTVLRFIWPRPGDVVYQRDTDTASLRHTILHEFPEIFTYLLDNSAKDLDLERLLNERTLPYAELLERDLNQMTIRRESLRYIETRGL